MIIKSSLKPSTYHNLPKAMKSLIDNFWCIVKIDALISVLVSFGNWQELFCQKGFKFPDARLWILSNFIEKKAIFQKNWKKEIMHNQIREFPHLGCSTSTPPLTKSIFSRVLYIEGMNVWMLWGEYYRYLLLCIPYEDLPLDSKHISEAFVRFQNVFEFPQHTISKWT